MKRTFIITLLFVLSVKLPAQSPNLFNYQAVVRNSSGTVIQNQPVALQISILQSSSTGNVVYKEEHPVTTNQFGLVNLVIGNGQNPVGSISTVNWGADLYFIKIDIDVTGGTNYVAMGTNQLLSVPYALYAASGTPGPQGIQGIQGIQGPVGNNGADGLNGQDGTGIVNTYVQNDSLYIYLTNGNTINAGHVTGQQGSQGVPGIQGVQGVQGIQGIQGPAGTYSAGTGILISGDTLYNSQPDQAITLQGGGATSVTGAYPDFTINSTDNNTIYSAGTGLSLNGTTFNSTWTINGNDMYNNNPGLVGIGTTTPVATLDVVGSIHYDDGGSPVSGNVLTSDASGFMSWQAPAISSSGGTQNYLAKFTSSSGLGNSLLYEDNNYVGLGTTSPVGRFVIKGDSLSPDSVPLFEVKDKAGSTVFVVWPEGAHVFVKQTTGMFKSVNRGSFAVSGKSSNKANGFENFFNVTSDSVPEIISTSEARILWYPHKNAFMTGQVFVPYADSVGQNSFASGFESRAIGGWSQALGFKALARGDYATAIGKNAVAKYMNSFAFGDSAMAKNNDAYAFGAGALAQGVGSFAIGSAGRDASGNFTGLMTSATGPNSFALGLGNRSTGQGSFSIGSNSLSSGTISFAIGERDTASGNNSLSIGVGCNASGSNSVALGMNCISSNISSVAIGVNAVSSFLNSVSIGKNTVASGGQSVAIGPSANSSGSSAMSLGYMTRSTSLGSMAYGFYNTSDADYSTAMGSYSRSSGQYSIAAGKSLIARSYNSFVVGRFNDTTGNTAFWLNADPLFVVGNGASNAARSNALTIQKNGFAGFNRTAATYPVHVGSTTSNGNGAYLTAGGAWTNGSSRDFKNRFRELDKKEILSKIEKMDLKGWYYKETNEYHIWPFAEDFYNAFGTGDLNNPEVSKYLSGADVAGVSLVAVQELISQNKEMKLKISSLENENAIVKSDLEKLKANFENIKAVVGTSRK